MTRLIQIARLAITILLIELIVLPLTFQPVHANGPW
jgi:hypothetical protein